MAFHFLLKIIAIHIIGSCHLFQSTRKLIFFLDPMRMGKVRIIDILISGFLDDLLELREEDVPEEKLHSNWFSASSAFRVYSQFLSMDKDRNGMLSRDE